MSDGTIEYVTMGVVVEVADMTKDMAVEVTEDREHNS